MEAVFPSSCDILLLAVWILGSICWRWCVSLFIFMPQPSSLEKITFLQWRQHIQNMHITSSCCLWHWPLHFNNLTSSLCPSSLGISSFLSLKSLVFFNVSSLPLKFSANCVTNIIIFLYFKYRFLLSMLDLEW